MGQQIHKRLPLEFVETVLEAFNDHRLGEEEACILLGLARARLYRLRRAWLRCQRKGMPFDLWTRPTSAFHHLPAEVQTWLHAQLRYIRDEAETFRGRFNFAFLAEQAQQVFGTLFHRNTLRRFALRQGYYQATPEEKRKVYTRFETAGPGMLFQHDSSHHVWLPCTRRQHALLLTKDDYSRRVVGGLLVARETAWDHLCLAHATVAQVGRPLAYYVDNHSIFQYVGYTSRHYHYRTPPGEGQQQFQRALRALEIGLIYTGKGEAQAKGKVEKQFDYFQRRLPFLCEKHGVTDLPEANRILQEQIAFYNEQRVQEETGEIPAARWAAALQQGKSFLRPVESVHDLEVIFALHAERTVKKDGTVSFQGRPWKVGRFPGQTITVCYRPAGKLILVKDGQRVWEYHL